MNRTALIAAVLSVIPLTAGTVTATAESYYRGGGYSRHVGPPVVYHGYGGYRRHFDHPRRHYWRPMPPWRRWQYWR